MEIIRVDDTLRDRYSEYISSKSCALLYHSLRYQQFLSELLEAEAEYFLARDSQNFIRGVLPTLYKEGPYGKIYNSLPFYGSNGGIIADNETAKRHLLEHYNLLATGRDVAASTLITSPLQGDSYDGIAYDFLDYRIGQLTKITYAGDNLVSLIERFHPTTRNKIRKAQRRDITVEVANDEIEFLREVHNENMAAAGGQPKPPLFFALLRKHFRSDVDYKIYVAKQNDERIGALLLFYFNQTVEYFTPVIKSEYRNLQQLNLIIFEAMRDASEAGYRYWNWGGTWLSQEGLHRFKKRWGTEDKMYTYYVKVNKPQLTRLDKQSILGAYPYFYVIPFQHLKQ